MNIPFNDIMIEINGKRPNAIFEGSFSLDDDGIIEEIDTGGLRLVRGGLMNADQAFLFRLLQASLKEQFHLEIEDWRARKDERAKLDHDERQLRDAAE